MYHRHDPHILNKYKYQVAFSALLWLGYCYMFSSRLISLLEVCGSVVAEILRTFSPLQQAVEVEDIVENFSLLLRNVRVLFYCDLEFPTEEIVLKVSMNIFDALASDKSTKKFLAILLNFVSVIDTSVEHEVVKCENFHTTVYTF